MSAIMFSFLHKNDAFLQGPFFYATKLLFYKLHGCKNTAFLQKYIFVKKAAFLCKEAAFSQISRL